jgi:hypothetical protein
MTEKIKIKRLKVIKIIRKMKCKNLARNQKKQRKYLGKTKIKNQKEMRKKMINW